MTHKTARIVIEFALGLLAIVVLLGGIALWRLSAGPVTLDFLTPRIEAALSDPATGRTVDVGSTELVWAGWARTVDLHARRVRILDRTGTVVATLPDVTIQLSLRALVQGALAPTLVEVAGADLRLVRGADGRFAFGAREGGGPRPDLSRILPPIIDELLSRQDPDRPLSFLRSVRIVDARLTVDDARLGTSWQAPHANVELRRSAVGLAGDVELEVALAETRADVFAAFVYDRAANRIDFDGRFSDLHPEAVLALVPALAPLVGLSTPLEGAVSGRLAGGGAVQSLRLELRGGAGALSLPSLAFPLPVRSVALSVRVDGAEQSIALERAVARLGTAESPGPELHGSGRLVAAGPGLNGALDVDAALTVQNVPLQDLDRYWPHVALPNVRAWVVENVPTGLVEELSMEVALRVPAGGIGPVEQEQVAIDLRYRGLEIHYLRPLPPVVDVSGTGRFDGTSLTFSAEEGHLGEIALGKSEVRIPEVAAESARMAIDVAAAGPLREALALLDHERLGLLDRLGIDPAAASGRAAARVRFAFPLLKSLKLEEMEIAGRADLEQVAVGNFLLGADATEGNLSLSVDGEGMQLAGPVRLADVPLKLAWREAFDAPARQRTELEVEIPRIEEAERRALGIDLAPYLEGPVAALLRYAGGGGAGTLEGIVDLEPARLAVEPLSWEKPPGEPGEARLSLELADQRPQRLASIALDAAGLSARGSGRFDPSGQRLEALDLEVLELGASSLRDVALARQDGDGFAVRIGGGVLDAEPLLDGEDTAEAAQGERADRVFTPLQVSASGLQRLRFAEDRYLEAVDLDLVRGRRGWERIALQARVPRALWSAVEAEDDAAAAQPHSLSVSFAPDESGTYRFGVAADDMGGVLRALDTIDTVQGGRVDIQGEAPAPLPTGPLTGRIEAHDYIVVRAPVLTRLLSLASLTGILDVLSGEGIGFDRLIGDFRLRDGLLTTDLVRAYGPALGLTAKGDIDFEGGTINLEGTVVPAYTVNRILGEIPLLGSLLIGGKGEGLVAFIYRLAGPLREPEVSVNPLSALTPGFLRGLFGLMSGGGTSDPAEQPRALPERIQP